VSDTTIPTSLPQTGIERRGPSKRKTLTFTCKNCDEAFDMIRALSPANYWAQIICLEAGSVTLHLRPLEEKDS
jgi:hypothetical protein